MIVETTDSMLMRTIPASPSPRWITCRHCKHQTNHEVVGQYNSTRYEMPIFETHLLLRCQGCDTCCYSIESGDVEDRDPYTGEIDLQAT